MGKTIAEKILSAKSHQDVTAGDLVVADLDMCMAHSGNRPFPLDILDERGVYKVFDPDRVILVNDHCPQTFTVPLATVQARLRQFAYDNHTLYHEIGDGIEHIVIVEKGQVGPGDLFVGCDSHSQTYGAINCFSVGVGSTEIADVLTCGKLWFRVPQTIRYVLNGTLANGVFGKDVAMYLIGKYGSDGALYKAVEYTGSVISNLSMDERFALSNMTCEMGAKTNFMEIDDVAREWLRIHHPKEYTPVKSDPDANIEEIVLDLTELEPQVAKPHTVSNVAPVKEVAGIPVDVAIIGTCSNGRLEDIKAAADILRGRRIDKNVRLYVMPGSRDILVEAIKRGYITDIVSAGGNIGLPGCDGCGSTVGCPADGQVVISAGPRNFRGRKGNRNADTYLGSPATVAASAVEGKIADCRKYI